MIFPAKEMKVLFCFFVFLILSSAELHEVNALMKLADRFDRLLVIRKDRANVGDPNPAAFTDPLHQRMKTFPFYTQTNVNNLNTKAQQYYLDRFGFNISTGFYNPLVGSYFDPLGRWYYFPVEVGRDDYADLVAFDSKYVGRGTADDWFRSDCAYILAFLQDGTFPAGLNSGKSYAAGDGLIYSYVDLLKVGGSWTNQNEREQLLCYTTYTVKQPKSMDGVIPDAEYRWECVDTQGKVGTGAMVNHYFTHNSINDEQKNTVIAWAKSS